MLFLLAVYVVRTTMLYTLIDSAYFPTCFKTHIIFARARIVVIKI